MAVFWFGLGKKIKNIFSKKEADTYYLQKDSQDLQKVNGLVDFYENVVMKKNGYVDYVDINTPTSMINLQYFNDNVPKRNIVSYSSSQILSNLGQVRFDIPELDTKYPLMIRFSLQKSSDDNPYGAEGTLCTSVILNVFSDPIWCGTNMFYRATSSSNGTYEIGDIWGMTINYDYNNKRVYLKAQLFNPTDKIVSIYMEGVRK